MMPKKKGANDLFLLLPMKTFPFYNEVIINQVFPFPLCSSALFLPYIFHHQRYLRDFQKKDEIFFFSKASFFCVLLLFSFSMFCVNRWRRAELNENRSINCWGNLQCRLTFLLICWQSTIDSKALCMQQMQIHIFHLVVLVLSLLCLLSSS